MTFLIGQFIVYSHEHPRATLHIVDGPAKKQTKWTVPEGLIVDGKFAEAGEFEIGVTWDGLETTVNITVA